MKSLVYFASLTGSRKNVEKKAYKMCMLIYYGLHFVYRLCASPMYRFEWNVNHIEHVSALGFHAISFFAQKGYLILPFNVNYVVTPLHGKSDNVTASMLLQAPRRRI